MIYWAPLFHFYQPPIQLYNILEKVCREAYLPLIDVFRQQPNARATVNINGVLTELLWEHGMKPVIDGLKELAQRGQIEFTGSAKYHPILPLIPLTEMRRQIQRNYLTNRHFFGNAYSPQGFFPPELAYSREVLGPVAELRHRWVLLSGVACPTAWPLDSVPQVDYDDQPMAVFFRDDVLSNKISFQDVDSAGFIQGLRNLKGDKENIYVVTAMDAETFGHHIQNWDKLFLAEVYETIQPQPALASLHQHRDLAQQHQRLLSTPEAQVKEIEVVTISQLLDLFPLGPTIEPRASSWSTSHQDLSEGNPFPLWKGKDNRLHELQWEHIALVQEMLYQAEAMNDNKESRRFVEIARGIFDMALHSCQFWWASHRPWWDFNMVHRGLLQQEEALVNAYKAIRTSSATEETKRQYYYKLIVGRELRARMMDYLLQ